MFENGRNLITSSHNDACASGISFAGVCTIGLAQLLIVTSHP